MIRFIEIILFVLFFQIPYKNYNASYAYFNYSKLID